MTQTTNVPVVKLTENPVLRGDVFYGSFDTTLKGKTHKVFVSNHLKDVDKKYNFRIASKCRAGFITISDDFNTPKAVISHWKKGSLVNIQVELEIGVGSDAVKRWFNVFTVKSGKWYSIDLGFLKEITVGTMRESFPDMCDMKLWEMVDAKTWADKAFGKSEEK